MSKRRKLTVAEYEHVLTSFQVEAQDRLRKLHQKSQLLQAALRLRLELELGRFPPEVRSMSLLEFQRVFHGDVEVFFARLQEEGQQQEEADKAEKGKKLKEASTKEKQPVVGETRKGTAKDEAANAGKENATTKELDAIKKDTNQPRTKDKNTAKSIQYTDTNSACILPDISTTAPFNPALMATPSHVRKAPRFPTQNECILSVNGSPILLSTYTNGLPMNGDTTVMNMAVMSTPLPANTTSTTTTHTSTCTLPIKTRDSMTCTNDMSFIHPSTNTTSNTTSHMKRVTLGPAVITVPLSVRKTNMTIDPLTLNNINTNNNNSNSSKNGRELILDLDPCKSPPTQLELLESPVKREVQDHLILLQRKLQQMLNKLQ